MGIKAVVVAVDKHHATVLVAGGEFKRIKLTREKLVVGQEIDLSRLEHFQAMKRAFGAVTALASIVMGLNTYLSQPVPAATAIFSIDINPSINMVVGGSTPTVLRASALDPSGEKILKQISLQGLPIKQALYKVTRWAKRDGYLTKQRSYVVLGAVFRSAHFAWFSKLSHGERKLLRANESWHGHLISVSTVTHKTLKNFSDRDVSVGRYLLWKAGHKPAAPPVSYRRVQQSPLSVLIKKKLHRPESIAPLSVNPLSKLPSDSSESVPSHRVSGANSNGMPSHLSANFAPTSVTVHSENARCRQSLVHPLGVCGNRPEMPMAKNHPFYSIMQNPAGRNDPRGSPRAFSPGR
ncbi:MAG: anti-sigma factor domain-containing protein [Firmicutes bacterium]|jgi:hypothetical protein|nr:anti-sigma factor domain-containing protein [Bacillota bacterium]